jgi:hypothetical protein
MNRIELAKAYAEAMGFHTHRSGGGWLYSRTDTPIAQGWDTFATKLERRGIIRVGVGIVWPR